MYRSWDPAYSMPFDLLLLHAPSERSIVVETRLSNRVENAVALEPGPAECRKYERLRSRHPRWIGRKPACGVYNCFGLLFASRRTSIRSDQEVEKVLSDDGYRLLGPEESPQAGDVVLYRDAETRDLLHGAQVMQSLSIAPGGAPHPQLLSKWDDAMGEDLHMDSDVPFPDSTWRREIWTDRPIANRGSRP